MTFRCSLRSPQSRRFWRASAILYGLTERVVLLLARRCVFTTRLSSVSACSASLCGTCVAHFLELVFRWRLLEAVLRISLFLALILRRQAWGQHYAVDFVFIEIGWAVMVICCSLPVPKFRAHAHDAVRVDVEETLTCGTPRGAGGRPSSRKRPAFIVDGHFARLGARECPPKFARRPPW